MVNFISAMFGCSHKKTTFPLTVAGASRTYVACLDCGKEFDYNWGEMHMGSPVAAVQQAALSVPVQSASR